MSVLVVVAHPDDATIGAGAMLASLDDVHVVHLTDGAPRDRRFVSRHFDGALQEYADVRAAEARQALLFANIDDVRSLGCPIRRPSTTCASFPSSCARSSRSCAPRRS